MNDLKNFSYQQNFDKLLSRKEVQSLLGIGSTTFFKWVKEKRFPVIHFSKRSLKVSASELEAFVRKHESRDCQ